MGGFDMGSFGGLGDLGNMLLGEDTVERHDASCISDRKTQKIMPKPIHSMYGIYAYIDLPGTTPTDRQSYGSPMDRLGFHPRAFGCLTFVPSAEDPPDKASHVPGCRWCRLMLALLGVSEDLHC